MKEVTMKVLMDKLNKDDSKIEEILTYCRENELVEEHNKYVIILDYLIRVKTMTLDMGISDLGSPFVQFGLSDKEVK